MPSGKLSSRAAFAAGAAACAALLAFAYWLQYARGLEPCPLCLVQRWFFYAVGALALLGALHGPGTLGPKYFQEAARVLGQAFDIAIATENLKNKDKR